MLLKSTVLETGLSRCNCNCDDNIQHFAERDNIQNSEIEMSGHTSKWVSASEWPAQKAVAK